MLGMSHTRRDEGDGHHFRSDRCVLVNGDWFVATREGIDVGPYGTREAAEAASRRIAEMLAGVSDPAVARQFIREFELLKTD
jgi:hypothetical protein